MRLSPWAAAALAVSVAACSQPTPQDAPPPVSAENHPFFPITAGAVHALGTVAPDGPMACESCHPPEAATFEDITCTGCHAHAQDVTDRLHLSVSGYQYQSAACYACHPASEKVPFDHAGIVDGCALCHDVGAVYAALPLPGFTHPDTGATDCGACHVITTWKGATGAPPTRTSDPQRNVPVTGLVPLWAATSITGLDPLPQSLPMEMNHGSPAVPTAAMANCAVCHPGAAGGAFYPGALHSSLANLTVAQPSACNFCHAGAAPKGFVGAMATSPLRTPPSPAMRHDAVAWSGSAPGSTPLVTQDCGVCHASPSQQVLASWSTGLAAAPRALFHASLALASQPQPGSCIDCHANGRPNGVLTQANSSLAAGLRFDHADPSALGDCQRCHAASAQPPFASWAQGRFHLQGSTTPPTCVGCHEGQRPTSTAGWQSTTYQRSPFDYGTNAQGITHGAGQECAACHAGAGTGTWGVNQNWQGGNFVHTATSLAGTTCIACHASQRPDLQPGATAAQMATLLGFDHSLNGSGDCFGCHQATVTAGRYLDFLNPGTGALPGGDWKNGVAYPGSTLVSGLTSFITVDETRLSRNAGNLVTGTTVTRGTLYLGMLHVASVLPTQLNAGPTGSPDNTRCWHCHTSTGTTVTAFNGGVYHAALTNYRATPTGAVSPFPQPTSGCKECHANTTPRDIVQRAGSALQPMDHAATFMAAVTIGGVTATGVAQLDCSVCHKAPGTNWNDGRFHANVAGAVPRDCVSCHYPLMADGARSDVTSGTRFVMKHRSPQLTLQACETCHPAALGKAATTPPTAALWQTGALHPHVSPQPAACNECHQASRPSGLTQSLVTWAFAQGGTPTNGGQYMSHAVSAAAGRDCAACHAADARTAGSAWSRGTLFHPPAGTQTLCSACHGLANGNGAVPGAGNNLPSGAVRSSTPTTASAAAGVPAGTVAQMLHTNPNADGKECVACHAQQGLASGSAAGREWEQARFHASFGPSNPLLSNPTTGRCSSCHLAEKPGPGYPLQDHLTFGDAPGTQDCASCHAWPGTGTAGAPNWLGATGKPLFISVGGFGVTRPPAAASTTQAGISNLPHPGGNDCTSCHADSAGGRQAKGYDHASALIASNCNACHEAGSDLVAVPWNQATTAAAGAGDTRPFTLASVIASYGNGLTVSAPNHFFPVDCGQCHVVPAGNGATATGAAYLAAWDFPHTQSKMSNPSTCALCHVNGIPGAPTGPAADPGAAVTVTAQVPRYAGTAIVSLSAQAQTLPMEMLHTSTDLPAGASSACSNCHPAATSGVYLGGLLHSSLANLALAQPARCQSCHRQNAAPDGFVGPTASSPPRTPASPEMKHDAVAWDGGAPTAALLVPADCGVCHAPPSETLAATWAFGRGGTAPAKYHPALAAAGVAQPGSCLDCHANNRPGALTQANAALPAGVTFDHQETSSLGDCQRCHARSAQAPWTSWTQGRYHLAGQPNPSTCLPCHAGERPTSTATWASPGWQTRPFDYVTNVRGITHGAGADCALCHPGPGTGAWGSTQNWQSGNFVHGPGTLSASSCLACHTTQRPDLQPGTTAAQMATLLGFDHSLDGTGDCYGCHQATVTAGTYQRYTNPSTGTLPGGDWKNGVAYPGSTLVSSDTQFITVTTTALNRTSGLVTSTSQSQATLFNAMLHVSAQLPTALNAGPTGSPDGTRCWHCHTSTGTTVTSYRDGRYHAALTNYRATPTSPISALPQPTRCNDCHAGMLPPNVVQKAGSNLQPMDHTATFRSAVTLAGQSVTRVDQADCAACHTSPGVTWADGLFHSKIGAGQPSECISCHYLLMADAARSDVTSGARYTMKHRSGLLTFQACETCHTTALSRATQTPAAGLWATGAYHPSLTAQPTACNDCHSPTDPPNATQSSWTYTLPMGGTASNGAQWLSHTSGYVVGKDCAVCHLADAKRTGSAWSKASLLHTPVPNTTTCNHCHGTANGRGTVVGTNNNLPAGLTNSATVSSAAGVVTGVAAGTRDQLTHAEVNVSAFECTVCHTQKGRSTVSGIQGREWAQARFHPNFTGSRVLVMNGTTGRCSNCHLNVKPGTGYGVDHSTFTAAPGTTDCSSCHSWPGTGTSTAPNWKGAAGGAPVYISVGGFTVPSPPAASARTQAGINNLPHPAGAGCTTCHASAGGGKNAKGYDHASALILTNCNSCHEAGSNLVSPVWNGSTTMAGGAGGTRPWTINNLTCSFDGTRAFVDDFNHFASIDCKECHRAPTGTVTGSSGSTYLLRWKFNHDRQRMVSPGTCDKCHKAPNNFPK